MGKDPLKFPCHSLSPGLMFASHANKFSTNSLSIPGGASQMKFPSLGINITACLNLKKKQTSLSCGACCWCLREREREGSFHTTLHKFSIKVITHMPSLAAAPKIAARCLAMKSQKCPAHTKIGGRFIMQPLQLFPSDTELNLF